MFWKASETVLLEALLILWRIPDDRKGFNIPDSDLSRFWGTTKHWPIGITLRGLPYVTSAGKSVQYYNKLWIYFAENAFQIDFK